MKKLTVVQIRIDVVIKQLNGKKKTGGRKVIGGGGGLTARCRSKYDDLYGLVSSSVNSSILVSV
jgi:hypothetical protein